MKKTNKIYLMSAGSLLPAFVGLGAYIAIKKQAKLDMTGVLIFAGLAIVGGFISAKMLKTE